MKDGDTSLVKVGSRKITRKEKSGSMHIVIPADLVKHMDLKEGEHLIFYKDPNDPGYTLIIKSFEREFPALGFRLTMNTLKGRDEDD